MRYSKDELEKLSLEAIKEHNLVDFKEISFYVPCCRATLYNKGIDKLDSIKEALANSKIETKVSLRKKWRDSDNATLQLALMKLVSTDEERLKLSQSFYNVDQTSKGEQIQPIQFRIISKDENE